MVAATRALLAEGVAPTVEQAAERAEISRTTAYRYFPNQRALLIASYPELDAPSLLDAPAPSDAVARLELVTESIARQVLEHEPELRAMLRLSLELPTPDHDALPLRSGACDRLDRGCARAAARPHTRAELRRLVLAIRATLGIEAFVWLTDIGGLSRDDAADLMRSSARTMLRSALADASS